MIDPKELLTTAQAAQTIGVKPGELLVYVRMFPHLMPVRHGRLYLWTEGDATAIKEHAITTEAGRCVHCGKPWDRPMTAQGEEVAQDAEGGAA